MMKDEMMAAAGAVFGQTNEEANRVLAFARDPEGALAEPVSYETGGRGSATPHLPSQGSVVLSEGGLSLLDELAIRDGIAGLRRLGLVVVPTDL